MRVRPILSICVTCCSPPWSSPSRPKLPQCVVCARHLPAAWVLPLLCTRLALKVGHKSIWLRTYSRPRLPLSMSRRSSRASTRLRAGSSTRRAWSRLSPSGSRARIVSRARLATRSLCSTDLTSPRLFFVASDSASLCAPVPRRALRTSWSLASGRTSLEWICRPGRP